MRHDSTSPRALEVSDALRRSEPVAPERRSAAEATLATLASLADALTCTEPDYPDALRRICRCTDATGAALFVIGAPHAGDVIVKASHGLGSDVLCLSPSGGVVRSVIRTSQPIIVPRGSLDPMALADLADLSGIGLKEWSLVCVPLIRSNQCRGALSVYLPVEVFSPAALEPLRVGAALLAMSVDAIPRPTNVHRATAGGRPADSTCEYANMVGTSSQMRAVYEQIGQVAPTNATVLVCGESGTGKELVAQAIHDNSRRVNGPFVKINCAALPETLFESELFGHERGAFSGAHTRRKGRFEMAEGGTLLLDEVGELSLATQAKLLRALQFREFERVGGTTTLRANIRIIAATNVDLEEAVRLGRLREDLFYRLHVFTIRVPALRERREDVPVLCKYIVSKYSREHGRQVDRISDEALEVLCSYDYPGNVRELENILERAVVTCDSPVLDARHLPIGQKREECEVQEATQPSRFSLSGAVEDLERRLIQNALLEANGNASRAARALGTTERVIRYKLAKYGVGAQHSRR